MSLYRKEWICCGSVSETRGFEPGSCPFCAKGADAEPRLVAQIHYDEERQKPFVQYVAPLEVIGVGVKLYSGASKISLPSTAEIETAIRKRFGHVASEHLQIARHVLGSFASRS